MPSHSTFNASMPRFAWLMQRICLGTYCLPSGVAVDVQHDRDLAGDLLRLVEKAGIQRPGSAS